MELTINIKNLGFNYGTSGWLKNQIETGEISFEESNDYYLPMWADNYNGSNTLTHSLIMKSKDGKNHARIAFRSGKSVYEHNVTHALKGSEFADWQINLTSAAINILVDICDKWIDKQNKIEEENIEISVVIKADKDNIAE